jgi:hypothetical protein
MRELGIRITGDDTSANDALKRTEDGIEGVTKTTEKEAAKQDEAWRKVGAAIGAVFSFQQLTVQAGKVTALTDRIDVLAKTLQMSTDEVQELGYAAKVNGDNIGALSSIMAMASKRIVAGDDSFVAALGKVGLSLDDLQGKRPADVFTTMATAISQVSDPLERSAAATALFGRSGAEHLPLLTANIAELRQKARDLGLVLEEDIIARGDALGDTWDGQTMRVDALRTKAMLPLLDIFTQLPGWIQTVIALGSEFSGVIGGIATSLLLVVGPKGMLTALGTGLTTMGGWLVTAGQYIGTFVAAIGAIPLAFIAAGAALFIWRDDILRDLKLLRDLFPRFVSDVGKWFADLASSVVGSVKSLYEGVKTWLVDKFTGIVQGVKGGIDKVKGFFFDLYTAVVGKSYIPDMVIEVGQWMQRMVPLMVDPTMAATRTVAGAFANLGQIVMGNLQGLASGVANAFTGLLTGASNFKEAMVGIWQSLKNTLAGIVNDLIENVINRALRGLASMVMGTGSFASAFSGMGGGSGGAGGLGGLGMGSSALWGSVAGAGVGGMVGYGVGDRKGTGAGILSGVGSGALTGMMIGGPIGAGIGAIAGLIGGVIGGQKNSTKDARDDFAKKIGLGGLGDLYKTLQGMGEQGNALSNIGLNVIGKKDFAANDKWMQDVWNFLQGESAKQSSAQQSFGAGGLTGMRVDEGPAIQPSITVNVNVSAWDAESVTEWLQRGGARVMAEDMWPELARKVETLKLAY